MASKNPQVTRIGARQIIRVRQGHPLPEGYRVVRILQTWLVPVGSGTASDYEYEVEIERV